LVAVKIGCSVALWAALSVGGAVLSWVIHGLVVRAKKKNSWRFSDPKYLIGASIVNMERAMVYDDGENFRFFARYAIRTCLGMPKAFPPNEPSVDEIRAKLETGGMADSVAQKITKIYAMTDLPDDPNDWKSILADLRSSIAFFQT
jgi:hypothetical protein